MLDKSSLQCYTSPPHSALTAELDSQAPDGLIGLEKVQVIGGWEGYGTEGMKRGQLMCKGCCWIGEI
jgi:hypothetical protein